MSSFLRKEGSNKLRDDLSEDDDGSLFDKEEQRPLISAATISGIHKLLSEQQKQIQDINKKLEEQQELHRDEIQKQQDELHHVQDKLEEITTGREEGRRPHHCHHNLESRNDSLYLLTGVNRHGTGMNGSGEDADYVKLDEDVFSLMMTNKVLEASSFPQMPYDGRTKRFVQIICGIGGVAMIAYTIYSLLFSDLWYVTFESTLDDEAFFLLGLGLIGLVVSSLEPDFAEGGPLEQCSCGWLVFKRLAQVIFGTGGIVMLGSAIVIISNETDNSVQPLLELIFVGVGVGVGIVWWYVSGPWFLGMVTFLVFQFGLGIAIIYDQWINTRRRDNCEGKEGTPDACLPFNIPFHVGVGEILARYAAVILLIATQTDILSSIQTLLMLRKSNDIQWDEVIGEGEGEREEDNRTWGLWIVRIFIPNLMKFIQASAILFASFVIIIQSETIVDLLKEFTAVLVISQADNLVFNVARLGYLGDSLKQKAVKVQDIRWKNVTANDADTFNDDTGDSGTNRCRSCFSLRVTIFGILCTTMIGGLTFIVAGQFNGKWAKLRYPNCVVGYPILIGDGMCSGGPYNTEECGFDGGDCIAFNDHYPNCTVDYPYFIGDGVCSGSYNTQECGFDGGDCIAFNDKYPECDVDYPSWIGDGRCDDHRGPAYNTSKCGFDGGDCL